MDQPEQLRMSVEETRIVEQADLVLVIRGGVANVLKDRDGNHQSTKDLDISQAIGILIERIVQAEVRAEMRLVLKKMQL